MMPKPQIRFLGEWLLIAAIAIAVLLRIINLSSREFWYDEVLSLLLSTGEKIAYQSPKNSPLVLADYSALLRIPAENNIRDSLETVASLLRGLAGEPHPPLFFLMQHLWLRLFGNGEAAMRSLVTLFSAGAIGSAYGLGRRLLGHRGGLLLAALLGVNPYYLFHSLNVRMYGFLVFWTILSAWALLELISLEKKQGTKELLPSKLLWSLVLIGSVTAGLMTFYYFVYWLVALAAVALFLDRKRSWQYGLCLGAGVLLTTPWLLWGTRQQMRNADLGRFAQVSGFVETTLKHLQELTQTLGTHLLLGDWVSSLPPVSVTIAGIGAIAVLGFCSLSLWQQNQRQVLVVAILLGIFPLLLALAVDVATGKFTVGFGFGRSMIFALPGCLLLLTIWLERAAQQWRQTAALGLLLLYLSISVADYSIRQRWMFHQVADIIEQDPTTPTLIVMNSSAWGHVLRLAYYIPPELPVRLLAQNSAKLAPALEKTLSSQEEEVEYQRILWLDSARPVWGSHSTESEKKQLQQVLEPQFQLKLTQQLLGTWELDRFTAKLYQREFNEP